MANFFKCTPLPEQPNPSDYYSKTFRRTERVEEGNRESKPKRNRPRWHKDELEILKDAIEFLITEEAPLTPDRILNLIDSYFSDWDRNSHAVKLARKPLEKLARIAVEQNSIFDQPVMGTLVVRNQNTPFQASQTSLDSAQAELDVVDAELEYAMNDYLKTSDEGAKVLIQQLLLEKEESKEKVEDLARINRQLQGELIRSRNLNANLTAVMQLASQPHIQERMSNGLLLTNGFNAMPTNSLSLPRSNENETDDQQARKRFRSSEN